MGLRTAALILALTASAAMAEEPTDCTAIGNDIGRLGCFDAAAKSATPVARAAPEWRVESVTNPMTDAVRTYIRIESTSPQGCGYGNKHFAMLEVFCAEKTGTWFVRIMQECGLPFGDSVKIMTRHDTEQPLTLEFSPVGSDDLQVTAASAQSLIGRLVNTKRFLIQIEPNRDYPDVIEFPVSGLGAAIADSGAGCKL